MQASVTTAPLPGTYWQWRGQAVYYVRAGEKHPQRPPILLVHGFGASTDHWRKNIAELQEDFEVWAIDLLGFGRSAKPLWNYGSDLWRDQLHDFITEVIGQPAVLVGNSIGGYATLSTASQHPSSAAGLVLLNSVGPFTEVNPQPINPTQKVLGDISKSIMNQPWAGSLLFYYIRQRSVIRKTLERVYFDKSAVTDQLVEEIYQPSCDPNAPQVFASFFRTAQGTKKEEKVDMLLKQLTCPLLMLWGERDPWMNTKTRAPKFRRHYPQLTEHYLQAGHCPHDEVPEQVNTLIRSWLLV
jgi:pimeloyl-ACP methyl ester carboxylesterase